MVRATAMPATALEPHLVALYEIGAMAGFHDRAVITAVLFSNGSFLLVCVAGAPLK